MSPTVRAGSLDANVIGMFPKNVAEFAYADLTEARKFSWYSQFKSQSLPSRFSELEQFLNSSGVVPGLQIEELAWAVGSDDMDANSESQSTPDGDYVVGVVLGSFDRASAEDTFKRRKLTGVEFQGFTLYPCGPACDNLYITFIDSSTIAFGRLALLERLLIVRNGGDDSLVQNEHLFPLINQVNGRAIFWGVLNSPGARAAIQRLAPAAAEFPQARKLIQRVSALLITVDGTSDLEAHLQVLSASAEDSARLAQAVQMALFFRQFQESQSNPVFAGMLESVRVASIGNSIDVSFSASNDQITRLIEHNTFSTRR